MEKWRIIEDYPNYIVSNKGNIMSLPIISKVIDGHKKGTNQKPGFLLKPRALPHGHQQVCLFNDKGKSWFYVHRLVAGAFLKRPRNVKVVMHLDDNPANNNVENLKWGLQVENIRWRFKTNPFTNLGNNSDEKAIIIYKQVNDVISKTGLQVNKAFQLVADKYGRHRITISCSYYKGKKLLTAN